MRKPPSLLVALALAATRVTADDATADIVVTICADDATRPSVPLSGAARKNYSCKNTSKTAAWLEAAPWRRDPTYLDALRVPPNVHLLAYGMSHVAQVAIAIACENADALVGPNGTRRTFDEDDPSRPIAMRWAVTKG